MTAIPRTRPVAHAAESANDRLKRLSGSWLWSSLIGATLIHFAAFAFWPQMSVAMLDHPDDFLEVIDPLPDLEIPDAPPPLERPARPVIADVDVADELTIPRTDWDDHPVEALGPPPERIATELEGADEFTPFDVPPRVRNTAEILRALERSYPATLRQVGIGGTVSVLFHVDETGRVRATRLAESSGHPALDRAALEVSEVYRFSPALNRDRRVAVWVQIPIKFEVR